MSVVSIPLSEFNRQIEENRQKDIRRRQKLAVRQNRRESREAQPMPEEISLAQRNGQWVARTLVKIKQNGQITTVPKMAMDNSPERALRRLIIDLGIVGTPQEQNDRKRLYQSLCAPSCNVLHFQQKPDVDGEFHYEVNFGTNVRMTRGDLERTFCAIMSQVSEDAQATIGIHRNLSLAGL